VGITAVSREVPGRNTCDRRHAYCIIIIIIIASRKQQSEAEKGIIIINNMPHYISTSNIDTKAIYKEAR